MAPTCSAIVLNFLLPVQDHMLHAWRDFKVGGSHLQVSENGGEIQVCDQNHGLLGYGMCEMLKQLIHLPNGPVQESLTVADIRAGSEGLDKSSANLLVAVQKVGAERIFRTRDGRDAVRLDVTCFDQSGCNLHLVMWDRCDVQFAKTWVPFQTILFISDAYLKWDAFRCGLIVQLTSRSICTVQPDCEEGKNLLQYAISAEGLLDDIVDEGSRFEPDFNTDLSKINRIFNVEQLKEVTSQIGKGRHLDAVLYCFFSEFDIDSEHTSIFSGSCGVCGGRVSRQSSNYYACSDLNCDGSSYAGKHHLNFDIGVTLSDSSGSINNCRLTGVAAERLFGTQPEALMNLSPHELTMIKWQFLLERCKVYVSAAPKKSDQSQADIWILFAERANLDEVTVRCSAA